jgi:3-oxoacyl-[acyl-carrier protein] reductase
MSQDKPVAIITGGGTGIGAACSRILSRDGFRVGINYIEAVEEQSRQVLSELEDGFLLRRICPIRTRSKP